MSKKSLIESLSALREEEESQYRLSEVKDGETVYGGTGEWPLATWYDQGRRCRVKELHGIQVMDSGFEKVLFAMIDSEGKRRRSPDEWREAIPEELRSDFDKFVETYAVSGTVRVNQNDAYQEGYVTWTGSGKDITMDLSDVVMMIGDRVYINCQDSKYRVFKDKPETSGWFFTCQDQ